MLGGRLPRLTGFRVDFWFLMKLLILAAMGLFLVYPFSTLITRSFFSTKAEGLTLYNYARFFSRPYYVNSLKSTGSPDAPSPRRAWQTLARCAAISLALLTSKPSFPVAPSASPAAAGSSCGCPSPTVTRWSPISA